MLIFKIVGNVKLTLQSCIKAAHVLINFVDAGIGRAHSPAHEIVSLEDYRQRHAQYKTDIASRLMHAAHPLICTWDDHESTNNPWLGGAQNHQPDTEGEWRARRNASLQAYFEWKS